MGKVFAVVLVTHCVALRLPHRDAHVPCSPWIFPPTAMRLTSNLPTPWLRRDSRFSALNFSWLFSCGNSRIANRAPRSAICQAAPIYGSRRFHSCGDGSSGPRGTGAKSMGRCLFYAAEAKRHADSGAGWAVCFLLPVSRDRMESSARVASGQNRRRQRQLFRTGSRE